jgi:hypothetical protein
MKLKILIGAVSLFIANLFLSSCDKIDEPFTKPLTIDNTVTKTVLLEDYTGQRCVNCPTAAVMSHDLKENLKDRVVIIAVHAGFFSQPKPIEGFYADYRTEEGNEWNTKFGFESYPSGMVNRIGYSNKKHILPMGGWSDAILSALKEPALLDLEITNEYSAATRELKTTVKTDLLSPVDKNLKLVVVITESGIVSPQKNNDPEVGETPIIYDYVHNHMLRGCINGAWGTTITESGTVPQDAIVKTFNYVIPEGFVAANCDIAAFVYDADTMEVLEAAEAKVVKE